MRSETVAQATVQNTPRVDDSDHASFVLGGSRDSRRWYALRPVAGASLRLLVAGIGNASQGDDGFGCAVAQRLREHRWPRWMLVADFGIRGVDLAYALGKASAAILIDAVVRGGPPGTLYVIEPRPNAKSSRRERPVFDPAHVLAFTAAMGSVPRYLRLVGCEPSSHDKVGLSHPVTRAVEPAAALVQRLVEEARCRPRGGRDE